MAVNKVVNSKTKSRGAMRNAIEYVLREDKVRDGLAVVTGPYAPGEVTWDGVYNAFLQEKKLWGKETGRMYAHNVISFHRDEAVTPEQCLEIGMRFAGKFFPHHQSLVGVHQDRNHLHLHVVTNSVSFADGKKLHQTKRDLEKQKEFTNALCGKMGLTVTEKGKHFDGSSMETGEVTAWSKDKYNLFARNGGKSYVAECARAVKKVSLRQGGFCKRHAVHGVEGFMERRKETRHVSKRKRRQGARRQPVKNFRDERKQGGTDK